MKFKEIKIGLSEKTFKVVIDCGNIPQGLRSGQRFVSAKDMKYVDKTFPKGTGMEFVDYAVCESPSSSYDYDYYMHRVAVFHFDGDDQNRQASAEDIYKG